MSGEKTTNKGVVDDGSGRRMESVVIFKITARQDGYPHGLKVAGADDEELGRRGLRGRRGRLVGWPEAGAGGTVCQGQDVSRAGCVNSG